MSKKRINKQGGFTLVELAVVMVIIGIILSAILKGQDLIDNARAKKALSDLKKFETLIWTFYDRQGRFPGDCDNSGFMGLAISPLTALNGDGTPIGADQVSTDVAGTTSPDTLACDTGSGTGVTIATKDAPVADLRVEHLLDWTDSSFTATEHVFDGNFHLANTNDGATPNEIRNAIILYNIPQWVGEMIDASIDGTVDGEAGRIRYIATPATAALTAQGTAWPARIITDLEIAIVYYFDKVAPVP